jgi:ribosomal protein L11 methyltransferase
MRTWPALEISPLDDLVQAALVDHDVAAIDDDAARVFFRSPESRDRAHAELQRQFPNLKLATLDVPDEDWAARSQASLHAVRVGNLVIAPPWDIGAEGAMTIVIEPSMGFGTGHHATTRLCLSHLQQIDVTNRTTLDVGTGSGVLAIAASRLGAIHVVAIDDDPDAIESARRNAALNPGTDVTLGTVDLRRAPLRAVDLVMANLTGGLLVSSADALQQLTQTGGRLILSGVLEAEEAEVLRSFSSCTIERRSQEGEWVCVTLSRSR